MSLTKETKKELLYLYDFSLRAAANNDDYSFGAADATGQIILSLAKVEDEQDYKTFEAYKRVMQFVSVEKYIKKYPTRITK